jgi:subtilisin family serine protease
MSSLVPPKKQVRFCALALAISCITVLSVSFGETSFAHFQSPQSAPIWDSDTTGKESVPGEILVRFRSQSETAKASLHTRVSIRTKQGLSLQVERLSSSAELVEGLRLVRVSPGETGAAIQALNADKDVIYAEPNFIWHRNAVPNDPRVGEQAHLDFIKARDAWDITTGSSSVVVGVLDGGVDINHQDLRDNIWTNAGEVAGNGVDDDGNGFVDDVHGWDFHHNDASVFDNESGDDHATHVAGIIGARGNNAIGVTGVCWQVGLLPMKVLGPTGGAVSNIIAGYGYARMMRERGVNLRILNNSYGGPFRSLAAEDAIQQLNQAGILFVVAAGNDMKDISKYPVYPANYDIDNVMVVGANAQFSNYSWSKVHSAAPGSNILSTLPNNTYGFAFGSSMAAPQVSGAAALLISAKPDLTTAAIKNALIHSNAISGAIQAKSVLDVKKALLAVLENDVVPPAPPTNFGFGTFTGDLGWIASGDDGNSGTVADYDLTFITSSGKRIPLGHRKNPLPPGSLETVINLRLFNRSLTYTLELRAYDNVGNSSAATFSGTRNLYSADPYTVSVTPNEPLSTGGQRLPLDGDDQYFLVNLPFNILPGGNWPRVTASTNGIIHFGLNPPQQASHEGDDFVSSVEYLTGLPALAGLWTDLIIDTARRPDAGVYAVQPNNDVVILRWQATALATNAPVNFEIEVRRDGKFICRYGEGNLNLSPVVGLSLDWPEVYDIPSHTHEYFQSGSPINLDHAPTVTFTPRPSPPPVTFALNTPNTEVIENSPNVTFTVSREAVYNGLPILGSYSVSYFTSSSSSTAQPGSDYVATEGTLTFNEGESSKTFTVSLISDSVVENNERFVVRLTNPTNGASVVSSPGTEITILDDDGPPTSQIQFTSSNFNVNENSGGLSLNVTRTGNLTYSATVNYATSDTASSNSCDQLATGKASSRCDYQATLGSLRFAPGESSKTILVPIVDDAYAEGAENFSVVLSGVQGAGLNPQATTTVQITDNEATNGSNPFTGASFFVRTHYIDFLNREPDDSGLAFWSDQITSCGSDQACLEVKRINVSAAFFLSIEFQETGYLVYRMYRTAYGNLPGKPVPLSFAEFLPDTQQVSRNVIVGQGDWATLLETPKAEFAQTFVSRSRFTNAYPLSMTPAQFVDALFLTAAVTPSEAERNALLSEFPSTTSTGDLPARARVLRRVAENGALTQRELNNAFVLMQYFGYLRRNPNDAPEATLDFAGYNFWLGKLNQFNGNFVTAEMVKAFIISGEYKTRFGP